MPPIPPVTQALMLICVGTYCLDTYFTGALLTHWFALYPLAWGFMPWQLVTYAFLHGSVSHLIFNMLGLWMFGMELETFWGRRRFIQYMTASILAAAVAQLIVTSLMGSASPTVGISGGIFGLLLAYGMLFPDRTVMLMIPPIPLKARTLVMVYGALELFQGLEVFGWTVNGIAHFAHLGGMLGGWLTFRYWRGQPPFPSRRRR